MPGYYLRFSPIPMRHVVQQSHLTCISYSSSSKFALSGILIMDQALCQELCLSFSFHLHEGGTMVISRLQTKAQRGSIPHSRTHSRWGSRDSPSDYCPYSGLSPFWSLATFLGSLHGPACRCFYNTERPIFQECFSF